MMMLMKILRQPTIWRVVCLASSLVGLLCYVLSSYLTQPFGKWKPWKILVYTVFCFIIWICLYILFTKSRQGSTTSLRLKIHSAFLVLTITSVYSFVLDKMVKGKPDVYSLISSAAFAIMSLSLSRLTDFGFEAELLYFFCSCLITQLMKINLLLVFVGVGFSYSLLFLCSCLEERSEGEDPAGVQDHSLTPLLSHIIQVDPPQADTGSGNIAQEGSVVVDSPLEALPELVSDSEDDVRRMIMPQLMGCIQALNNENERVICMVSKHVQEYLKANEDSELQLVKDDNLVMDEIPRRIVKELCKSVKLMIEAGLEEECHDAYQSCRREFLQECLCRIGLQDFDAKDDSKIDKIGSWIKASNVTLKILFPSEMRLCDQVFSGFSSAVEISFVGICSDLTIRLLNFANSIVTSPNLVSSIVSKVFGTLCHLTPEFEPLLSSVRFKELLSNYARRVRRGVGIFMPLPELMGCIEALEKENEKVIHMVSKHIQENLKANEDSELQLVKINKLVVDELSEGIVNDLCETVELLVEDELEEECRKAYNNCRRKFLQEFLSRFGLQDFNAEDVHMIDRIESWIKASNIALRILFPNEKRLCDRVFPWFSSASDISFMSICRDLTLRLLSFANSFATGSHSLNLVSNIFPKVFGTLSDLIPEFESLFTDPLSEFLRNDALMIQRRLSVFVEMESHICRENMVLAVVTDGGLHPLTHQVMNYLCETCEWPRPPTYPRQITIQITDLLVNNLEANSKAYADPALGHVFIINNRSFIQHMAEQCGLRYVLGDDWLRKNSAEIKRNIELYQRSSWDKVRNFLKLDSNELVAPNVVEESMKDKLNLFNLHFEEISNLQSTWCIFDEQLKEQIITSLKCHLRPEYGNFIERLHCVLGWKATKYIAHGILHIEHCLNNLFLVGVHKSNIVQTPKKWKRKE